MDNKLRDEFWHTFQDSPFVMIRLEQSHGGHAGHNHAEPMTAMLDRDAHHTIWFFVSRGNRIAAGGSAMAQFASKGHDVFACLAGRLVEETDPARIDRHWSNTVEAWFPKGRNDPALMMLRFEIEDAEVWTADPGIIGTFKLLAGAKVRSEDMGKHEVGLV